MTTVGVEPEDTRLTGSFSSANGQLDPVLDWHIFGLAGTVDIVLADRLLKQNGTSRVNNLELTVSRSFEGLIVRTVLFSFLSHQTNVGDATHGGRVELTVLVSVFTDLAVDGGVAAIRNHSDGVLQFVSQVPHTAAVTNNVRHRSINDDVVRDVQVGDVLAGVNHRQSSLTFVASVDVSFDFSFLVSRKLVQLVEDVAHTQVRVGADRSQGVGMLVESRLEVNFDAVTEHDWVGNLHHGCFEVQREQYALLFGLKGCLSVERLQSSDFHD